MKISTGTKEETNQVYHKGIVMDHQNGNFTYSQADEKLLFFGR
jgi:hypothetical protein